MKKILLNSGGRVTADMKADVIVNMLGEPGNVGERGLILAT